MISARRPTARRADSRAAGYRQDSGAAGYRCSGTIQHRRSGSHLTPVARGGARTWTFDSPEKVRSRWHGLEPCLRRDLYAARSRTEPPSRSIERRTVAPDGEFLDASSRSLRRRGEVALTATRRCSPRAPQSRYQPGFLRPRAGPHPASAMYGACVGRSPRYRSPNLRGLRHSGTGDVTCTSECQRYGCTLSEDFRRRWNTDMVAILQSGPNATWHPRTDHTPEPTPRPCTPHGVRAWVKASALSAINESRSKMRSGSGLVKERGHHHDLVARSGGRCRGAYP